MELFLVYISILLVVLKLNQSTGHKISKNDLIRSSFEHDLLKKLFADYNRRIKPYGTIQVKFSLTLNQIVNVIEKDQIVLINVFMDHEWVDKRIAWNPKEYNNITLLRISADQLWT